MLRKIKCKFRDNKGSSQNEMTIKFLHITFIFLAFIVKTYSQCCSGGVPISGSPGFTSASDGAVHLRITYDYNVLNDLFASDHSLNDNSRTRITHSGLLEVNYGLNRKVVGTQLSPSYKIIASISYNLSREKDEGILDNNKSFKITEQ